jgi:hypothetical protein
LLCLFKFAKKEEFKQKRLNGLCNSSIMLKVYQAGGGMPGDMPNFCGGPGAAPGGTAAICSAHIVTELEKEGGG